MKKTVSVLIVILIILTSLPLTASAANVVDDAVSWAVGIANDDKHGYDQTNRYGPDYDCSSLLITAYKKAGVNINASYTGDMYDAFIKSGFENVTKNITLSKGTGLKKGDVLLTPGSHTEMVSNVSGSTITVVHASINENGGTTGGKTGDQTKKEICTKPYSNRSGGWTYVLRYKTSASGWIKTGNDWYYKNSSGGNAKGWLIDGENLYYLHATSGVMLKGWQTISGKKYYFRTAKDTPSKGPEGSMCIGWQKISGKWYYLHTTSGVMLTGWQTVSGQKYYLNSSGVMLKGWQTISGKKYYFRTAKDAPSKGPEGSMCAGWQKISDKWYYLNSSGVMLTGWQTVSGQKYYLNSSGVMLKGWQKIFSKWYYFRTATDAPSKGPEGSMLKNGTVSISGKSYKFNADGICTNK